MKLSKTFQVEILAFKRGLRGLHEAQVIQRGDIYLSIMVLLDLIAYEANDSSHFCLMKKGR
ncbi:hypothetical protein [Pseudomonas palleroniana]